MTPTEPPRRPKPITREQAEEVARQFHESYERQAPEHGYETREDSRTDWSQVPEKNRGLMIATAYDLLDRGEIVALDHRECHAVTELLANLDVDIDQADSAPLDNAFKADLVGAFRKLAFASGRQYGLSNFDMGIEEDPS